MWKIVEKDEDVKSGSVRWALKIDNWEQKEEETGGKEQVLFSVWTASEKVIFLSHKRDYVFKL